MATFKSALAICGLSQKQAADYLDVSLQTVKHWTSGRNRPPEGVWLMLGELFERIQAAADNASEVMSIDGVDPRAWANLEADLGDDSLPAGAASIAGAIALLTLVEERRVVAGKN